MTTRRRPGVVRTFVSLAFIGAGFEAGRMLMQRITHRR
jgi:hypothetical protein